MGKGPEIEHVFNKPSLTDWIAKINKDLKGAKTAEELKYHIEDDLSIDAIQSYTEKNKQPIFRNRDRLIACHIDTHEPNSNTTIKELLGVGVNTLILDSYSDVNYEEILNGVILDYIQIVIYPMDHNAESAVLSFFKAKGADMAKVYAPSSERNLIHIPFDDSISNQLSLLLEKVNNSNAKDLLIVMDGQKDFLSEISKIRAAHILLSNLFKATKTEISYNLLSHTKASSEGVHELIQSSYMGLAAIIGEADGIVSVALNPKYKLNAVHTYNLLTMESYLGKVKDPASGSDLIEEMTEVVCQKSWANFVSKQ